MDFPALGEVSRSMAGVLKAEKRRLRHGHGPAREEPAGPAPPSEPAPGAGGGSAGGGGRCCGAG